METSFLSIAGTIKVPPFKLPCGLEKSSPPPAQLSVTITPFFEEILSTLREQACQRNRNNPDYWKVRIIVHLITAPNLYSVTFLPFELDKAQVLFVQKDQNAPYHGFFAPYLPEKQQEELGCIKDIDEKTLNSIQNVPQGLAEDIFCMATYFLQDPLSRVMGLTYYDKDHQLTTLFWSKAQAITLESMESYDQSET